MADTELLRLAGGSDKHVFLRSASTGGWANDCQFNIFRGVVENGALVGTHGRDEVHLRK